MAEKMVVPKREIVEFPHETLVINEEWMAYINTGVHTDGPTNIYDYNG